MSDLIGAIDQGTQSTRLIVFDKKGEVVVKFQKEHKQITPQEGWVEHDPEEIMESVVACMEGVTVQLASNGYAISDLKGIGITNQRETTVVWDRKTGKPLHNAIVWLDTRTHDTCEKLSELYGGRHCFRKLCGLPVSTYFSGVKLKWLLDNKPEIRAKAEKGEVCFGTIDSWIIFNLCDRLHITDVTNASRTMLMNINTCEWDPELCRSFGVPLSMLPEIRSSSEVYGQIAHGSLVGTPISGCLGDQQSACVGHCAFAAGDSKNTYGSGCFMLLNTGTKPVFSENGLLTTVCYKLGPEAKPVYALEGSVAIAGVGVSWLKDNLGLMKSASESEEIAGSVEDTGGVYLVPAFSGLFAPYWREDARGVIIGLTQYTQRAHIVRAMLEAVCFQTADIVDAMIKDSGTTLTKMTVDGGMTANDLLMQLQADTINAKVMRPSMGESTALGAALAAGLAVGVWDSVEDMNRMQEAACNYTEFVPKLQPEVIAARKVKWHDAVQRSLNWT
jgi:glycerol kinase